jgi:hypothetical protein
MVTLAAKGFELPKPLPCIRPCILLSSTYWQIMTTLGMMICTNAHLPYGLTFRLDNPNKKQFLENTGH